uniref:Uncharacterized protein n=1 Tax=Glossina pallidipes TaxID=7398 RepID=A0A1B0A3H1_GLOPL
MHVDIACAYVAETGYTFVVPPKNHFQLKACPVFRFFPYVYYNNDHLGATQLSDEFGSSKNFTFSPNTYLGRDEYYMKTYLLNVITSFLVIFRIKEERRHHSFFGPLATSNNAREKLKKM